MTLPATGSANGVHGPCATKSDCDILAIPPSVNFDFVFAESTTDVINRHDSSLVLGAKSIQRNVERAKPELSPGEILTAQSQAIQGKTFRVGQPRVPWRRGENPHLSAEFSRIIPCRRRPRTAQPRAQPRTAPNHAEQPEGCDELTKHLRPARSGVTRSTEYCFTKHQMRHRDSG